MESKTPPDSKPPTSPKSDPADQAWISPRLREKLGDAEPGTPKEGSSPWVGIVLAVLVIGGGAGLFATMRSGAAKQKADAERFARERAAAAAAESTANAAKIDSMRIVAAARAVEDSIAGRGKKGTAAKPAGAPARPASTGGAVTARSAPSTSAPSGDAVPAAPRVVEKGPFGLDVGTFLALDRANSELARLSTSTGLKGRVITRTEDGGDVYHVVLGSFASRTAANQRAESLVGRALVNQAQAISLAP